MKLINKLVIDDSTGVLIPKAEKLDASEITGQVGDLHYVHEQITASATWYVVHNLGKHPTVHLEDSTGSPFIAPIQRVDDNSFYVYISSATGGKAYCN